MRRLFQALIVLLLVTVVVFFAMRLLPGDPVLMVLLSTQIEEITQEQLDILRQQHGLDRPMIVQYFDWLGGVIRGDLGVSILQNIPVSGELMRRLPITLHLGILAFIISAFIGIPAGIICAIRRGTWIDTTVTILANVGITVPTFWLGIILIYFFALNLGWLPVMGYTSPFEDFWLSTRQIIMPVICMAVFPIASEARQTRSSMLEVMHRDYIRTAWSKGIRERMVVIRHALKNALIPVITLKGMSIGMIIGGAVLIETVFNIPGMGRLAVSSVLNQDYQYVQGIILIVAVVIVFGNLLVDIVNGWLDPRIRYN